MLKVFYYAEFYAKEEEKKVLLDTMFQTTLPKWLAAIEKRLKTNSSQKFISGDKMTIADFALASLAFSTFLNERNPLRVQLMGNLEHFPVVNAYFIGLGEELKEHLSTRAPSSW